MTDELSQISATQTPTATEPPMVNSPAARTETGELRDQSITAKTDKIPAAAAGAPETYAEFVLPEGATIDKATLEAALPVFKELGLSQEAAQKLVDLQTKNATDALVAAQAKVTEMRDGWIKSLKADPEIGNILDTKVRENIGKLKATLPEPIRAQFDEAVNFTGAGDHPGLVKALNHWAKFVTEGSHVPAGGPSAPGQPAKQAPKSLAGAMYPNLPQ